MSINYEYDFHKNHELIIKKDKYVGKGLTGLVNLGNKCYLNSTIACLSNTLKLTDYFLSAKYQDDDPECTNRRKNEYYLVLSYLNLLINIWETNQSIKPKSFIENISKFVNKYFTLQQQDSHECLMYILDILHKGICYEIDVEIKGEVQNESDKLMKQSLEQWKDFYKSNYSMIIDTFNGMIYNKIDCVNCDFEENVFEPFNSLSLNINHDNSTTLTQCLDNYFSKPEQINTWNCEKCKNNGCAKTSNVWSLPNYLIVHLKRFTNDGKKDYTQVDFPLDDLNLTSYMSKTKNDPNNYIYTLYAVNYHSGDTKSGHYWSACKNLDNNWYLYNDANISKFHDTKVLTKDAYMLFYYRKYVKTSNITI
jgi:ubiquitin carboxyl-terminal hydrolase 8